MCGIVGYIGKRPAYDVLLGGLKCLEYRGYDSAGMALLWQGSLQVIKAEGRLKNLERLAQGDVLKATSGIGHTRWATHGKPSQLNAHPHRCGHVTLVHNGIVENYLDIKRALAERGQEPISQTDSELLGWLIFEEMEKGNSLKESTIRAFSQIKGQCSVVVMSEKEPGVMVGVNGGPPLVAATDPEGGTLLASDAQALLRFTRDVVYLKSSEGVVADGRKLSFFDIHEGLPLSPKSTQLTWTSENLGMGGFPCFMMKEIHEQPGALLETMNQLLDRGSSEPFSLRSHPALALLDQAKELYIVACGTSWHAALLGKYWIERWAKKRVSVEIASEFRYRNPVVGPGCLVLGISQSGETADTLAVMKEMKKNGIPTLAITNVPQSSLAREVDAVFYTLAGPEIGVASTKTFTTQLLLMYLIAGYLARAETPMLASLLPFHEGMLKLPHLLSEELREGSEMRVGVRQTVYALKEIKGFFFMGRGYSFPIALEGALKLKELAYDYAEGYAAGELKHGPIAMIDQGIAVIVLAPRDSWRDKTVSNLEEVKARGAVIIGIGDGDDSDLRGLCHYWIPLSPGSRAIPADLLPFLMTPVLQLFSYERALLKGNDVDKPRNLAKSVTVE